MLKGGLVYADAITTVSSTYAEEIKTPFYGEGLDGLMRASAGRSKRHCQWNRLRVSFNPETDPLIVAERTAPGTFRKEKIKNKKAVSRQQLGLRSRTIRNL